MTASKPTLVILEARRCGLNPSGLPSPVGSIDPPAIPPVTLPEYSTTGAAGDLAGVAVPPDRLWICSGLPAPALREEGGVNVRGGATGVPLLPKSESAPPGPPNTAVFI